ncbi:MAG: alpha/beta fold hydrolase [Paracoccus sp. (in: a-proteobacteria)]|uniref:alpha/beta fold hydrolase n=1 Tax=Paracoccus sp. TaxID=267 RepID=UPI00405837DF
MMHWRSIRRNNVTVRGEGERTLVLAHGFGCDQNMWRALEPHLAGFRLVFFDYTGSGQSDLSQFDPMRHSQLEGFAEDLGEICDALDLRNATLIGHSVSGMIGLMAALARPDRFAKLVMVCPSPCFLNMPDYPGGFEREDLEELLALMDRNYIGWATRLAPVVTGQPAGSDLTQDLSSSFCSTDPFTAKIFAEATFLSDHRGLLGACTHPVLILQSARDVLATVAVGDYLCNSLACARMEVIDADGHYLHMTHPEIVAQNIRNFVAASTHA